MQIETVHTSIVIIIYSDDAFSRMDCIEHIDMKKQRKIIFQHLWRMKQKSHDSMIFSEEEENIFCFPVFSQKCYSA